jgi:hypothetical protein
VTPEAISEVSAFISQPLAIRFTPFFWEGDEGCSVSPDTGQQGGAASFEGALP